MYQEEKIELDKTSSALALPQGDSPLKDGFITTLAFLQVALIFLFGFCIEYGPTSNENNDSNLSAAEREEASGEINRFYAYYQDVHIMIFIGFGFLMTFLRKYGYSAVGINFLLSAFCVQWTIFALTLTNNIWAKARGLTHSVLPLRIDMASLINADFGAGAVMISFGGVLGKATPTQLLWMAFIEIILYSINIQIGDRELHISDVGGTFYIHCFGAYFGLAVAKMLGPSDIKVGDREKDNKPVYHSDLFSMIGTIFLWCFWPSFNAALAQQTPFSQERTVINTLLSISSSCMAAFLFSKLLRHGKFEMVDVQNATLAGGVAVGACANFMLQPFGALIIGTVAGAVSTTGFALISTWLWEQLGVHDTAGIHNLHGMPSVLGAIASAIAAVSIPDDHYSSRLQDMFPERTDGGRTGGRQAGAQIVALLITLFIAVTGGIFTGLFLRSKYFVQHEPLFSDEQYFHTPAEEIPTYFDKTAPTIALQKITFEHEE